jgi:NAD(P)H dehydrogenase (quinone)
MSKLAIVFYSGYGHTARQAEAVRAGAASIAGAEVTLLPISKEGDLPEGGWDTLAAQDAIIYGSPTYMGGPAWQFKKFADESSKPWFSQAW